MSNIYYFTEFKGKDNAERLKKALEVLKNNPYSTLIIEPGEYLITTELARQAQDNVMNGRWGDDPQSVMFSPQYKYSVGMDFSDHRGTTVIAKDVKFMIDGFMETLSLTDCEDVTVEGLTIDHKRKPFSVGRVTSQDNSSIVITLYDEFPVYPKTPINMRSFIYNDASGRLEEAYISNGTVIDRHTLRYQSRQEGIMGKDVYIWHTYHSRPAILMQRAKNITVKNVTVHSHPGMGITANRTENILLDGFCDVPAEGLQVSTNTDATHFTECSGRITVSNCKFIGQGDDAINVHGYYHTVMSYDGCRYTIQNEFPDGISHTQVHACPNAGDIVEINRYDTLELIGTRKILDATPDPDNGSISYLTLDAPLPADEGKLRLFNISHLPCLEFAHCYCRGNFARGVLAKTRNVHIHDNLFEDTMGTAVNIYAEGNWSEGTNPANVLIENNTMLRCGYNCGSNAVGGVQIGVHSAKKPTTPQLKDITVINNRIDCPDAAYAITAESVIGLKVENNKASQNISIEK